VKLNKYFSNIFFFFFFRVLASNDSQKHIRLFYYALMLHNFESLSIILFFKLMQPILSLVLNKQSFKVPYICLNTFERISSSFKVRRPVYIVLLTSRKSIETQMRFALSRIQTSVLHEPKINIFSARMHTRVQLKICYLSPAAVALIQEEASHRNAE